MELLVGKRQLNESDRAVWACNEYLQMGPKRSLQCLLKRVQSESKASPTNRLATLKNWSSKFAWQERARAFDAKPIIKKHKSLHKVHSTSAQLFEIELAQRILTPDEVNARLSDIVSCNLLEVCEVDAAGNIKLNKAEALKRPYLLDSIIYNPLTGHVSLQLASPFTALMLLKKGYDKQAELIARFEHDERMRSLDKMPPLPPPLDPMMELLKDIRREIEG